jgi:DivIVA domain-containing protein
VSVRAAFDITLRGYDIQQVDRTLDLAELALASDGQQSRQYALEALRTAEFRKRLRGYDREQVDRYIQDLILRIG